MQKKTGVVDSPCFQKIKKINLIGEDESSIKKAGGVKTFCFQKLKKNKCQEKTVDAKKNGRSRSSGKNSL